MRLSSLPTKTAAALQSHWIKPELGNPIVALNMAMFRLVAIPGIEEESIRSDSQDSWHRLLISASSP